MLNMSELINDLRANLSQCDFHDHQSIVIGQAPPTSVISTNGKGLPKLICAVAPMPSEITTAKQASDFMQTLRRGLTSHFPGFPRPKRLGTCTVLLGDRKQCKALQPHKSQLIDQRGLHINVMLGTVLIDTDNFTTRSDISWGLMDITAPFSKIQSTVDNWCSRYRHPKRLVTPTGRTLKIA
ncbi:MAG: hypothetical protein HN350_08090 [Phycisphaerales bacterium]|jgi:hypothetical protein|nr:hypothetical protein [Phycisphaerales bacterium]